MLVRAQKNPAMKYNKEFGYTTHPAIMHRSRRCAIALCESPEGMRREGPDPAWAWQASSTQFKLPQVESTSEAVHV